MKITDIRSMLVGGIPWTWLLVRVDTDEGVWGLGEAQLPVGVRDILERMKPIIVGQDPRHVVPLAQKIYREMSWCGSLGGSIIFAMSGVEIALWDLAGKITGQPIWQLLGGKYRDTVRIYADRGRPGDRSPRAYAEEAQRAHRELGYTVMKFDIDHAAPDAYRRDRWDRALSTRELKHMAACAQAAREALPDEVDVCLDLHWNYQVTDALNIARRLEGLDILWLEDPTPPENLEACKYITDHTSVPIATGENLYTAHGLRLAIEMRAADIITPDLPRFGGLQEGKKVAELCELHYLGFAPHNICTPVGTVASAHVCAAVPNFLALEHHGVECPWWDDIADWGGPVIEKGTITIPDRPGHGVTLNEDTVRAHLAPGETWWGT